MKLLMFAASLSKGSINKKLIHAASQIAQKQDIAVDLADFATFCAPHYNADVQTGSGFPKEIDAFVTHLKAADGLVISSPEYNFSTPAPLKNLIDWVSRLNPMPWRSCPILLMSASPSLVGGNRGLWATRVPLEACGAFVYPDMFSLASAHNAFDEQGHLTDSVMVDRLRQNIASFAIFVQNLQSKA